MVDRLSDTDAEALQAQRDLLRKASPSQRLRLAFSLSTTTMTLSRQGLGQRYPEEGPQELGLRFVALHYGRDLAEAVRQAIMDWPA